MFDRSRLIGMKDRAVGIAEKKGYVKVEGDSAQLTEKGVAFGFKFSKQFPEIELVIFLHVCGWIASELRNPERTLTENAEKLLEAMGGIAPNDKDKVQDEPEDGD